MKVSEAYEPVKELQLPMSDRELKKLASTKKGRLQILKEFEQVTSYFKVRK